MSSTDAPAGERHDNPFRYSEPVSVGDLINRDAEATTLLERASEGNNSRLMAPRRFGKTSLLRRALHDAQREGWAAVYVDFFGVLTSARMYSGCCIRSTGLDLAALRARDGVEEQ